jgi:hypothetical protein
MLRVTGLRLEMSVAEAKEQRSILGRIVDAAVKMPISKKQRELLAEAKRMKEEPLKRRSR